MKKPAVLLQPTVASGQAPFDRAFIDSMVPHHQAAIEMADAAKEAGITQPELIKIADDIIATQQVEIDQMLEWRQQWFGSKGREPEAAALEVLGLTAAEAGMEHDSMDLATADDVDQAFAGMMIGHHVGAIRMAKLGSRVGLGSRALVGAARWRRVGSLAGGQAEPGSS